jgi:hypothetical protein
MPGENKPVGQMTTKQVRKLMLEALRDLDAGKITAKKSAALVKAANKRLKDIRKVRRNTNPQKLRDLIGD